MCRTFPPHYPSATDYHVSLSQVFSFSQRRGGAKRGAYAHCPALWNLVAQSKFTEKISIIFTHLIESVSVASSLLSEDRFFFFLLFFFSFFSFVRCRDFSSDEEREIRRLLSRWSRSRLRRERSAELSDSDFIARRPRLADRLLWRPISLKKNNLKKHQQIV